MWPFLSYGQCPVPSCPDKGSLSVLANVESLRASTASAALTGVCMHNVCVYWKDVVVLGEIWFICGACL